MILTYDIESDRLRTKFSKFIMEYGRRLQYSVYEIENSDRYLKIITSEIRHRFEKKFGQADSVLIFRINSQEVLRFGYAKNEETDLIIG